MANTVSNIGGPNLDLLCEQSDAPPFMKMMQSFILIQKN